LKVWPNVHLSEIRSSYYQLAKIHHPDHGGCQNIFLKIHSAYKNLRANVCDSDGVDVELSAKRPLNYKTVLGGDLTSEFNESLWSTKKTKIRNLLRLGHFPSWRADNPLAITLANSPHMTDGFTEFFCLYLYGVYTIDGATVLEVIDFMIDKTYFMMVFKK